MCSILDSSVDREITRIERFLRVGTETNVVNFRRKSSLNAFLSPQHRPRAHKPFLKCVHNIWSSVQHNEERQRVAEERIRALIVSSVSHTLRPQTLAIVTSALLTCQTPGSPQSPLRGLALWIIRQPFFGPQDVLQLVVAEGRKRVSCSRPLRQCLQEFYARDFGDAETEELLTFGNHLGWTHSDVIVLTHVKVNPLTEQLTRRQTDDRLTTAERRLRLFRSHSAKVHQIVSALDETSLKANHWFRALNTQWRNNSKVWLKVVDHVTDDYLLSVISEAVKKFPNHKHLFEQISRRLQRQKDETDFSSNFSRALVSLFLARSPLRMHFTSPVLALNNALSRLQIPPQSPHPLLLLFHPMLDFERQYLSSLTEKKRVKEDSLDATTVGDLLSVVVSSFRCHGLRGGQVVAMETVGTRDMWDSVELPLTHVPEEWRRRVLLVSDVPIEACLWPKDDNRLAVLHLNRCQLLHLSPYRPNLLILNGFDVSWESALALFFQQL